MSENRRLQDGTFLTYTVQTE